MLLSGPSLRDQLGRLTSSLSHGMKHRGWILVRLFLVYVSSRCVAGIAARGASLRLQQESADGEQPLVPGMLDTAR
jgi:hypothetical protein